MPSNTNYPDPATFNLTVYKGASFGPLRVVCRDAVGALVNLTGYSAFAKVRKMALGPVIVDLEPTIPSPTAGEITFGFTDEQTAELPHGVFVWDLMLQDGSGQILGPFLVGAFTIKTTVSS